MQEKALRKPLRQIARELNVDAVVEGSVARSGDRVRITAQLNKYVTERVMLHKKKKIKKVAGSFHLFC